MVKDNKLYNSNDNEMRINKSKEVNRKIHFFMAMIMNIMNEGAYVSICFISSAICKFVLLGLGAVEYEGFISIIITINTH